MIHLKTFLSDSLARPLRFISQIPGIATTGSIHGVGVCVLAAAVKHSKTRCNPLSVCARVTEAVGVFIYLFFFHVSYQRADSISDKKSSAGADISSQFSCVIARSQGGEKKRRVQ